MKKILCIGSVTADVIVKPADSLPAPGTLRSVDSISAHVGGCAANASIDLRRLGADVTLCCRVGSDMFGDFVKKTVASEGVDTRGVCAGAEQTTVSIVCSASSGERSFLYLPGSAAAFTAEDVPEALLREADIVFVAGAMLLPSFDGAPCAGLLKKAKEMGKYTVMDTAWDFQGVWMPKIAPSLPYLDLFMPSLEEALKLTGAQDESSAADALFALGCGRVIIKLGSRGALLCESRGSRKILPTYSAVKPKDTTGAGDAFCAGFLAALARGDGFYDCGRLANAVGTFCVGSVGASSGVRSMSETEKFMEENPL